MTTTARPWVKAYIALGSNLDDRLRMIEQACKALADHGAIRLLRTSLLYETTPMYVEDQGEFLNAACEIETALAPMELLDALQNIERVMGRIKTIDKGPRNVDLDILLYDDRVVDTQRLIVPHKLMLEREFVLRPLTDLIPEATIPSTRSTRTVKSYLEDLPVSDPPLSPIVPFGPGILLRPLDPRKKTKVMSILNVTPDSFSDGGAISHLSPELTDFEKSKTVTRKLPDPTETTNSDMPSVIRLAADRAHLLNTPSGSQLCRALAWHIRSGSDIIDIGGQSTRPGAESVGDNAEIERIQPALQARATCFPGVPTSLDTYRASVAATATKIGYMHPELGAEQSSRFETGCHIINDISAGAMEPEILTVAAQNNMTIVLMHMRGTPETMNKPENLIYPDGVIAGVAEELKQRVAAAEAAGIPRWRIVLDPGIGFSKSSEQNLELLKGLQTLRDWPGLRGIPWLVGTSRKNFIGEALGMDDLAVTEYADSIRDGARAVDEVEKAWAHADEKARVILERPTVSKSGKYVRDVKRRDLGTAATVAAAVQGGADVVRVHNVRAARDVIAVADAIWRRP
ncbi:folic acid synthesis protein fol1 [Sphaceloma murrayae]|uniref:Folic acid synthesis protein fol1 n=1 Tax=Sphaceloma murrayae TaxID=2082308 RepID=A0A2K1QN45_9PEZI|nr:folic acid synthesis protein fol1 [Sphaceloma murrayae]